jgi:hypothetical protein
MLKKVKFRPFLLLEVLLALFLVTLCILPLLAPSVAIFRDQQHFIDKVDLDHAVGVLYARTIEKLHRNAIPWEELNSKKTIPIDSASLQQLSGRSALLPWNGTYLFEEIKHKPKRKPHDNEPIFFSLHLFRLTFTFTSRPDSGRQADTLKYSYDIFVARQLVQT